MRLRSFRAVLLPFFATVALAACSGSDDGSQPGGSTPEAAVKTSIELIKTGDFNTFWKHGLPPADYATLRSDWALRQKGEPPVTAEDRARFAAAVQQVTGPDAENTLYATIQPKLTMLELQYKDQLPVLISVGEALAKNAVAQSKNLAAEQKAQVTAVLDVLAPWAQKAPWFDQAKAKQNIGILVTTARKLDLKSPDQVRTMDFDTTMNKYSTGYAGLKQVLASYGLSLDDTLDSVKATQIDSNNGHARVKIDYTLLGKPLSSETKLVQVDGRWYSEDMLNNVRDSHKQLTAPAVPAADLPANAASAPTGPTGVPATAASTAVKD
jgi:hypothetical protein